MEDPDNDISGKREANTPLLTIVTITFNAEIYLERTLQSVQKALTKSGNNEIEYLIIDGGSTDHTLRIASEYIPILTTILSEPDQGLYDAMNKGMALARGKYLWFLNAGDEVYDSGTVQKLLTKLKKGSDLYYSDAMLVRQDGSEVGLRSKFTPHRLPTNLKWQDFATGMKVCHQAFIVTKDLAPPYDITNLSADIDWEINCLKKVKSVVLLDFVLCRYLMGGLSVTSHQRSLIDRYLVLKKHFGFLPSVLNHLFIFWRGFWFKQKNGKYW